MDKNLEDIIASLVREMIEDSSLFIVEVAVRGRQGSRVVEVFLDGDSGIGVDDLATISRQLAVSLDEQDLIKGKYNLNVSSPGAERALKLPRQYRQHAGRKIELEIKSGSPDAAHVTASGELISSSEDAVVLQRGSGEKQQIPFGEIEKARIVTPW